MNTAIFGGILMDEDLIRCRLIRDITSIIYGKQMYFQEGPNWFSRVSGKTLTQTEMIDEFMNALRGKYD